MYRIDYVAVKSNVDSEIVIDYACDYNIIDGYGWYTFSDDRQVKNDSFNRCLSLNISLTDLSNSHKARLFGLSAIVVPSSETEYLVPVVVWDGK